MELVEKKSITHFAAGLVIAAILIIYSLALTFMDLTANRSLSLVSTLFLLLGIVFFILQFGKSVNHTATFGELFSFGFKATAIATLIVIAFQVLFFLIFPEYKEKIFEMSREQMLKQNAQLSDAQMDQALDITKKFFWPFLIGGALFINMIVGAIASLIGASITKKVPQSPFQEQA